MKRSNAVAMALLALALSTPVSYGAVAVAGRNASQGACHLMSAANTNNAIESQDNGAAATSPIKPPGDISQMACLSSIINAGNQGISGIIRAPSISGILNVLKQRACQMAQNQWNKGVAAVNRSAQLPYGLGGLSGSGTYQINLPGSRYGGTTIINPGHINSSTGTATSSSKSSSVPNIFGN
jgi:hypothetical protein